MTWSTATDVHALLAAGGDFLRSRPVEHTVLLTEAAYLQARPSSAPDQAYGWWRDAHGEVAGAFLRAPGHPPILSAMPRAAVAALPEVLGEAEAVGVDGALLEQVSAAWRAARGVTPVERSRITLYRLERFTPPALPAGRARVAGSADRELLLSWFHDLMAAFPDDPSEAAYVIDDPLGFGGITLWEVAGRPVAMAGRSRLVAGMVRLGAVHAPGGDEAHAAAAFTAACAAASEIADHVLVFAGADAEAAATGYRELGFRPVLDRVMLGVPSA
ncbi:GNAT family N-acetyltransferase [Catellatospora vulcania]|uniref:GNAT family N-acetyltransferase n=1 Tax=Catellatospora vulcania TaxID=1460450 RepID=UPI0012D39670|nr:GNAT family N-acetyltransferase [Catellatospora vulcania]